MAEPTRNVVVAIATSNRGKLEEFVHAYAFWMACRPEPVRHALSRLSMEPLAGIASLPECVEDGETFSANARKKALHYSRFTDALVLSDDSGLAVEAFGGAPGVRSRRYAGESATDEENNSKLLAELASVPDSRRTARFVCAIALARSGGVVREFLGESVGAILKSPRGSEGFGYDPLFLDAASGKSFAELSRDEKLRRSHRGRAVFAMFDWLATNLSAAG